MILIKLKKTRIIINITLSLIIIFYARIEHHGSSELFTSIFRCDMTKVQTALSKTATFFLVVSM